MEKLLRFNPDVIFVENIVNILALDYLQSKGVTVISNLKHHVVDNIKKVSKIRKKI
jgi:hypothetical protein